MESAKHTLTVLNRLAQRKPEHEQWLRQALSGRLERLREVALDVENESGGPIGRILRELQQEVSPNKNDSGESVESVVTVVQRMVESLCEVIARDHTALRDVEWRDLERVIAVALEKIGFTVELTAPAKDGGKDVIATCRVENQEQVFYVEIKHWKAGGHPGIGHILDFIEVNARAKTDGGLFLSSSGYAESVHSRLAEISHQRVRLGQREKIVSLCQQFVLRKQGVWSPDKPLPEVLFDYTLAGGIAEQQNMEPIAA